MTNGERIESIRVLINAQKKFEELKETVREAIIREFNREPHILDEYSDMEIVKEYEQISEEMSENTNVINGLIDEGATLEDIAKVIQEGYIDEKGNKHTINYMNITYINLLDLQGTRTNLKNSLGELPEYRFDVFGAYSDLARDLAKKGIEPEELPQEALYDVLFIDHFIESKAITKEIDKGFKSSLIAYMENLEKTKGQVSLKDISQAIKNQERDDDESR